MKNYVFEIQSSITIEMEGETKEEARANVINHLEVNSSQYVSELIFDCCVSDGKEVKQ